MDRNYFIFRLFESEKKHNIGQDRKPGPLYLSLSLILIDYELWLIWLINKKKELIIFFLSFWLFFFTTKSFILYFFFFGFSCCHFMNGDRTFFFHSIIKMIIIIWPRRRQFDWLNDCDSRHICFWSQMMIVL